MYMKKQSQRKKNSVIVAGVVRALQIRSLVDTRSQASHKSKLAEQEHNAFSLLYPQQQSFLLHEKRVFVLPLLFANLSAFLWTARSFQTFRSLRDQVKQRGKWIEGGNSSGIGMPLYVASIYGPFPHKLPLWHFSQQFSQVLGHSQVQTKTYPRKNDSHNLL